MNQKFDHLDDYKKASARQKLEWLEEAKKFVILALPGKKLQKYLKFREEL